MSCNNFFYLFDVHFDFVDGIWRRAMHFGTLQFNDDEKKSGALSHDTHTQTHQRFFFCFSLICDYKLTNELS